MRSLLPTCTKPSRSASFREASFSNDSSAVKRQMNLKDYGNLIPGHGGILDRFDSMMLVAPLMEILLRMLPFAVPTIGAG